MELTFNFDGGNERGEAVWSFVSYDSQNQAGPRGAGRVPDNLPQTNNVAEWSALLHALLAAKEKAGNHFKSFLFRGDSELVIKQMLGIYACKNAFLEPIFKRSRGVHDYLTQNLKMTCEYEHVRREFNKEADELGRIFRDKYPKQVSFPLTDETK